jgi:two-component system, NtrC family, nitrogen regulation response regulator NtrX
MQQLRDQVQQVAVHRVPVLLVGEAGTGREAFARYLHAQSPRAAEAFVTINGADLDVSHGMQLLRGRQDGERIVPGLYDQAGRGTLFIQGLEDLSPTAQAALAADIDHGAYIREGGSERLPLTCRFVSAAQPGFELKGGEPLRRDLLSHLNVMTLRVPPLREYAEDVPELLRYYVDRLVDEEHLPFRRFSVAAQNRLRNYPWPGNVHELRNLVQRLLILGGPEEIPLAEIERELAVQLPQNEPLVKQDLLALPLREAREQFERAYLQQQLLLCNGKVGQLAKRVGMERTHLYRKLRSLGVDFRQTVED